MVTSNSETISEALQGGFIQPLLSGDEEERQGDKPSVVWNIEYMKSNMGWSHRGDGETWVNGPFLWVRDSINPWAAWTQTGTNLPNAIGRRWNSEACNIDCKSCWRNWPQLVNPGRKWALSKSYEEMFIKAGIQCVRLTEVDLPRL